MSKRKVPLDKYIKYAENHTREEIVKHFGVTKNYVDSMKYHQGISYKPREDVPKLVKGMSKAQFIEYCSTHTYSEVKKKFNTGASSPYLWEERYGFKLKETPNPNEQKKRNKIIYEKSKKQSQYSLAKEYGLTRQRIHAIVEVYKNKEAKGEL